MKIFELKMSTLILLSFFCNYMYIYAIFQLKKGKK